jgi:hypothetical protein
MKSNQGTTPPFGIFLYADRAAAQAVVSNRVKLCRTANRTASRKGSQGRSRWPNSAAHAKHPLVERAECENMVKILYPLLRISALMEMSGLCYWISSWDCSENRRHSLWQRMLVPA